MSVNEILKILGGNQRKYKRLHFSDFTKELALKPATISNRMQLPSFFKTLFDDNYNVQVHSVSGKKYSFWHSFLYVCFPDFINTTWFERKKIVDQLIDELDHDVECYFTLDKQIKETNMSPNEVKFQQLLPSDELIYYISSKFNINIILCDTTKLYFYYKNITFNREHPTMILYRDDSPMFHVISIDDKTLFSSKDTYFEETLKPLYSVIPEINRVLKNHIPWPNTTSLKNKSVTNVFIPLKGPLPVPKPWKPKIKTREEKIETYTKVNKVSDKELHKRLNEPSLKKLKLAELQQLATMFKIDIKRQGKTKQVFLKKSELISKILYHSLHTSSNEE